MATKPLVAGGAAPTKPALASATSFSAAARGVARRGAARSSEEHVEAGCLSPRSRAQWLAQARHALVGNLPPNYTTRQKVSLVLEASPLGRSWDVVQTLLSLVASMVYVRSTYEYPDLPGFDAAITLIFTVDYFLRLYAAQHRLRYAASFFAIIDVLTCLPNYIDWLLALLANGGTGSRFSFFRFVRILRMLRILRSFKLANSALSALSRQVMVTVFTMLSLVFLFAGSINLVESNRPGLYNDLEPDSGNNHMDFNFFNAVYYAVVTVATVGYGEFHPKTWPGKAIAVFFIICSIILIPMQVTTLGELMASQSKYRIKFAPEDAENSPHVLVFGGHEGSDLVLLEFFSEFFHPDRREGTDERFASRQVVILGEGEPSEALVRIICLPAFEGRIFYVRGSPLEPDDLDRISAQKAEACFSLCDVTASDRMADDRNVLLRSLVISAHAPKVRLFVHVGRSESVSALYGSSATVNEIVCVQDWKTCLLAQTCLVPGFSTLLNNLLRAQSRIEKDEYADLEPWEIEYNHGASMELYPVPVPHCFDGLSYSTLVLEVFERTGGTVHVCGVREPDLDPDSAEALERKAHMNSLNKDQGGSLQTIGAIARANPLRGAVIMNPGRDYRLLAMRLEKPEPGKPAPQPQQVMYVLADNGSIAATVSDDDFWLDFVPPESAKLSPEGRVEDYGRRKAEATPATPAAPSPGAASKGASPASPASPAAAAASEWTWESNSLVDDRESRWLYRFTVKGAEEPTLTSLDSIVGISEPAAAAHAAQAGGDSKEAGEEAAAAAEKPKPKPAPEKLKSAGAMLWGKLKTQVTSVIEDKKLEKVVGLVSKRRLSADHDHEDNIVVKSIYGTFASIVDAATAQASTLRRFVFSSVAILSPPVRNHIIVCSSLRAFKGFLAPLRAAHTRGTAIYKQIVLLTQSDSSLDAHETIEEISYFSSVAVIIGSPSSPADLVRAGISTASCLLLLSEQEDTLTIDGETLDTGVVFNYLVLEQVLSSVSTIPTFYVVIELLTMGNLHVLNSKRLAKIKAMRKSQASILKKKSFRRMAELASLSEAATAATAATPRHSAELLEGSRQVSASSSFRLPSAHGGGGGGGGGGGRGHGEQESSRSLHRYGTAPPGSMAASARGVDVGQLPDVSAFGSAQARGTGREPESGSERGSGRSSASAAGGERASAADAPPAAAPPLSSFMASAVHAVSQRLDAVSQVLPLGAASAAASAKVTMTAMHDMLLPPLGRFTEQSAERTMGLADAARAAAAARSSRRRDAEDETANNAVFKLPFYAAGYAFPMDTLQTFLVSAYFNPEITRFAEQLLMPGPKYGSRLICEPVPRRFHGRTYRDLWRDMLRLYDAVVIGIYRSRAAAGSQLPFVYLTPMPGAPLYSTEDDEDLMYVLTRQPLFVGQNARAPGELVGMEDVFGAAASANDVLASGTAEAVAAAERRRQREAADREERRATKLLQSKGKAAAGAGAGAGAEAKAEEGPAPVAMQAAAVAAATSSQDTAVTRVADVSASAGAGLRAASLGPGQLLAAAAEAATGAALPGAIADDGGAAEDEGRRARRASQRALGALAQSLDAAGEAQPFTPSGQRRSSGYGIVAAATIASAARRGSSETRRASVGGSKRRSSNFGALPLEATIEEKEAT